MEGHLRLSGSQFGARQAQGQWAEGVVRAAINSQPEFTCVSYGISSTAPSDKAARRSYYKRVEASKTKGQKRPDLAVFRRQDEDFVQSILSEYSANSLAELTEAEILDSAILSRCALAIEVKSSRWDAKKMDGHKRRLTPQERFGGKLGLPASVKVAHAEIKRQEYFELRAWARANGGIPILICNVFMDVVYGISLTYARSLIRRKLIDYRTQDYERDSKKMLLVPAYRLFTLGDLKTDDTSEKTVSPTGRHDSRLLFASEPLRWNRKAITRIQCLARRQLQSLEATSLPPEANHEMMAA